MKDIPETQKQRKEGMARFTKELITWKIANQTPALIITGQVKG